MSNPGAQRSRVGSAMKLLIMLDSYLVESREYVSLDDRVADVAEVAEELVVVGLAVGQALPLVVPVTVTRVGETWGKKTLT